MADPPDFQDLARRYLDLWQEQWSAMASDPEAAEAMSRLYGMMGQQMAAAAPMAEAFLSALPAILGPFAAAGQATQDSDDRAAPTVSATAVPPAGAAPAGAASGGGSGDVDELARRVAALEERLAKLEAKRPARRPAAKSKPRKG